MREQSATDRLMREVEPLDLGAARRLLTDAFAATDLIWEPDVSEDFREIRALALARWRRLPEPGPSVTPLGVTDAQREAISSPRRTPRAWPRRRHVAAHGSSSTTAPTTTPASRCARARRRPSSSCWDGSRGR